MWPANVQRQTGQVETWGRGAQQRHSVVGWSVARRSFEPCARRCQPGWPRLLHFFVALVFAFLSLGWMSVQPVSAQVSLPADVIAPHTVVALPTLPPDFVEARVGPVTWAYHPSSESLAKELSAISARAWRTITEELGVQVPADLTIRIARGPKDMVALAPAGAPPPNYAVGVAYPNLGLIILSVVEPNRWLPPDLKPVLTHELSHVALHRAVQGHPVPLWFTEGLAVYQAREQNLSRIQTLWEASVAGGLLPLSSLSLSFPTAPHQVNLAYAESADLVRHMLRDSDDQEKLANVVQRVAEGASFDRAVLAAYRLDLPYLEREWRQSLRERFQLTPLLLTGSALWVGIAILFVFAVWRRRREKRQKLARWAEEEALHERAIAALEMQRRVAEREEEVARDGNALPPEMLPEADVPTIVHDGRQHTLH